jgi:tetratricopeptide (TPR) repeat protein
MSNPQQYYQVGGTLKPDDPSYIERQADKNLYDGLKAGKFCYVFNSRQMGKSSLQVRVSKKLANEGFRCVLISLDSFGARGVTQQRWYYTFIQDLADKFELPTELLETWLHESRSLAHVKRFSEFLEKILLPEVYQNIIIFIDEIDTVLSLDFPTNDFFAFIRYCYNQRAINPNFKRITFCLLGVATPSQLIQDNQRTPFNIGEAIQLKNFSYNEARTLAEGLESKVSDSKIASAIIQEVLNWTDGQPFLTQKICEIIVDDEQIIPLDKRLIRKWVEQLVTSRIINNWEEQDNPQHLRTIRDRILNSKEPTLKLLKLYQKIRRQQELPVDDSPEQSELLLSGLVLENNRKLKISNRIYEFVFDSQWVSELLADKRPYEEELLGWLSSDKNKSWLLQKEKLQTAMQWCAGKNLTLEDYQFINASQELEISFLKANQESQIANLETKIQKSKRFQRFLMGISAIMITITGFSGFQLKQKIQSLFIPYISNPELFSQGEHTFFLGDGNVYLKRGIEAFNKKDYSQAVKLFEKAKKIDINDPEAEIYYNNARALPKG